MKDNWKEEFDEKFLNYVHKHQSKFLLPKNPSNQDTLEWLGKIERSLVKDIRDFIQEALTTQKESFIKIIDSKRVGGGEIVTEYYGYYNQALDDLKKELENLCLQERR